MTLSTSAHTVTGVTVRDGYGTDYSDLFAVAFDYSAVISDLGQNDLEVDPTGSSEWWNGPEGITLASRKDIRSIVERWAESEEEHGDRRFSWDWNEPWGAYVLPFYDGVGTGYLSIADDGEGKGRMPFASIICSLDLTYTVAWSTDSEG